MLHIIWVLVVHVVLGCGADIQREEKGVQKSIKEAAKRNDMTSAKVL